MNTPSLRGSNGSNADEDIQCQRHKCWITSSLTLLTMALGALLLPTPAYAQDITTGLVGHWTMDETSGNTLADSAGANDITWTDNDDEDVSGETVTGQIGTAIHFDATDDYATTPSINLSSTDAVTVSLWVNRTYSNTSTHTLFEISSNTTSTTTGLGLFPDDTSTCAAGGEIMVMSRGNNGYNRKCYNQPTSGVWHHLVVVADRSQAASSETLFYIDGVLQAENGTNLNDNTNNFGTEPFFLSTRGGTIEFNENIIDDVRIYTRALTAADVAALYAYTGSQDITTGLVGHWTLDETSGNTLADSAGANDGTWADGDDDDVSGETNTSTVNSGLLFDGVDDYADMGSTNLLDGQTEASVCFWMNYIPSEVTTDGIVAGEFFDTIDSAWLFWVDNTGSIYGREKTLSWSIRPNWGSNGRVEGSDNLVTPGQWDHYCGTFLGGSYLRLFKNGILDSEASITTTTVGTTTQPLRLGSHANDSSYLNAMLDDVRIYTRALTAADVAALYDTGSCTSPSGMAGEIVFNDDNNILQYCSGAHWIAIGPAVDLSNGLVGHWTLDETSGNTITDSSGSGNNGTWSDGDDDDVSGETVTGQVDTALDFDGVDDHIYIMPDASLEITGDIAISAWIETTNTTKDEMSIFAEWSGVVNRNYHLLSSTGVLQFRHADSAATTYEIITSGINIADGNMHHVTFVAHNNLNYTFYIDGMAVASGTLGFAIDPTPDNGTRRISGNPSFTNSIWSGTIDDVRLYNRAISATEVSALYAMGPSCPEPDTSNLVGHWTMDETSGTAVADSTTNSYDMTLYNGMDAGTDSVAGQVDTALEFSGATSEYASSDATIDLSGTDAVTVSTWVNRTYSNAGGNTLFEFSSNTNSVLDGFGFFPDDTGSCGSGGSILMFHRGDNGWNARCFTQPSSGIWHHLVAIYDKGQSADYEVSLYIDGVRQTSYLTNFSNLNRESTNNFGNHQIFLSSRGGTLEFNDNIIDDFRIYDHVLSSAEILSLYGATGGTCSIYACSDPFGTKGEIVYNTSYNVMQYCNGASWIAMGPPGDGGATCASPSGLAGELRYSSDQNVLMYCEGDEWIAVAGHAQ